MIEKFFKQPTTLSRLQSGLLGPHLSVVASALDQMGYSTGSIRPHLRAADHFGTWLLEQKIEIHDINDAVVDRYLLGLVRQRSACSPEGKLPHAALGLRHLIEILRQRGAVKAPADVSPTIVDEWLGRFDRHLDRVAGCAFKSRGNYLRYARRLLYELFADTEVARLPASRLTILVVLKLFQKLHRFPNADEVPAQVVNYVRTQLRLGTTVPFEYKDPFQRARQRNAIREYTGFMAWCKQARHLAVQTGYQAALVMARPADISNAIIAALTYARFELPAFSTLEHATKHARALAHRKLCGNAFRSLTAEERRTLDRLLVIPVDQRRTAFQAIKRLPQRPSRKHLKESVDHLEWLDSLGNVGTEVKDIAPSLVRDFAKQARTTDAGELKDFAPAKRYTLLLCLIYRAKARTRDAVAGTVVRRIATIHKRAKNELLERQTEQRERVDRLLGRLGEVIDIVATERSDERFGQQVRTTLTHSEPIESLQQEYSAAKNWTGNNYLPLLWQHYKGNRAVLFRAINALKLNSATQDNSLIEAWNIVGERNNRRADWLTVPPKVLHFVSARWRALLRHPTDPTLTNRRQFEVCLLSYIGDHLQAGNLCVPGSEAFADHRAELLPWAECERRLKEYCDRVDIPATAEEFVKELQRQMAEVATQVDGQFPQNTAVKMGRDGMPVLLKYGARVIPESAQRLHLELMRRLPQRNLLDILVNVEHLTNFTSHFGPASDSEPKIERAAERYLLTASPLAPAWVRSKRLGTSEAS